MKARFETKQPPVNWQPLDNNTIDVTICLNGQEVMEESDQMAGKEQLYWEYDFNQFREKVENISQVAIEKNPEKYLDYKPAMEKKLEQKVQEQNETIKMLIECLLEMSEAVYA